LIHMSYEFWTIDVLTINEMISDLNVLVA